MRSSNKLSVCNVSVLAVSVVLTSAIYLLASQSTYAIGFPLDDSWIHQTYARNLALRGEWAFRPGLVSAGSTAPLWSALLALGFLIHLSPYIWTYFLGALTLFALACVGEWGAREIMPTYRPRLPWVWLFLGVEWHLVWAAMSGMETLLHALLATAVLILLMTNSRHYLTFGLLIALSVWVRPDGLTLLGPVMMALLLAEPDTRARTRAFGRLILGFGALFVPYLLFNLAIGGTPMPNTFYAKQAEYVAWQTKPVFERLGQMFLQLLVGTGFLLVPGAIAWLRSSLRQRDWGSLSAMTWCAGYLWLYISRLPAYHHGRYLMPAMPIFFLFGLLGLIDFVNSRSSNRLWRFVQMFWQTSVVMVSMLFIVLGARAYALDVAVIESEMVQTAKWVAANLPTDAIIAAHDIGALGYFDDHKLVDLAGLISPEVIPFIRDEERLSVFLNELGADYLIAFPEFYPELSRSAEAVFTTEARFASLFNQENMSVFRWAGP